MCAILLSISTPCNPAIDGTAWSTQLNLLSQFVHATWSLYFNATRRASHRSAHTRSLYCSSILSCAIAWCRRAVMTAKNRYTPGACVSVTGISITARSRLHVGTSARVACRTGRPWVGLPSQFRRRRRRYKTTSRSSSWSSHTTLRCCTVVAPCA